MMWDAVKLLLCNCAQFVVGDEWWDKLLILFIISYYIALYFFIIIYYMYVYCNSGSKKPDKIICAWEGNDRKESY